MAEKRNIVIEQGASFSKTFTPTDENDEEIVLEGQTASAQMRRNYTTSNSVSFTAATSGNTVTISLTANQTANIEAMRYVFDVQTEDEDGLVFRRIEGVALVTPGVTRV